MQVRLTQFDIDVKKQIDLEKQLAQFYTTKKDEYQYEKPTYPDAGHANGTLHAWRLLPCFRFLRDV